MLTNKVRDNKYLGHQIGWLRYIILNWEINFFWQSQISL